MIETLNKELKQFIDNPEPEVLVVMGDWGIGKTYVWKNFIKNQITQKKVKSSSYAYISLFGLNSVDSIKTEIFLETLSKEELTKGELQKGVIRNTQNALKEIWSKTQDIIFNNIGLSGFSIDLGSIGWSFIKNILVCFDDIERRGNDLELKDLFGLVSLLKESRNSKIVIILNNKELCNDDQDTYHKYREKIIDREIIFKPSLDDIYNIALLDRVEDEHALQCIDKLGINNLRTLYKIRKNLLRIKPFLLDFDEEVKKEAVGALVLFTYLNYTNRPDLPTLDQTLDMNMEAISEAQLVLYSLKQSSDSSKSHTTDEIDKAEKILKLHSFYPWLDVNNLDLALGSFIKEGWLNEDALKKGLEETQRQAQENRNKNIARELVSKTGDALYNSLEDNSETFLESVKECIKFEAKLFPALNHLAMHISTIRKLGLNKEATQIIEWYVECNKDNPSPYFDTDRIERWSNLTLDQEMLDTLNDKYKKAKKAEIEEKFKQLDKEFFFKDVIEKNSTHMLSLEELEMLSYFSEKEIHKHIKSSPADNNLKKFLEFFFSEHTGYHKPSYYRELKIDIFKKLDYALKRILTEEKGTALYILETWGITKYYQEKNVNNPD